MVPLLVHPVSLVSFLLKYEGPSVMGQSHAESCVLNVKLIGASVCLKRDWGMARGRGMGDGVTIVSFRSLGYSYCGAKGVLLECH